MFHGGYGGSCMPWMHVNPHLRALKGFRNPWFGGSTKNRGGGRGSTISFGGHVGPMPSMGICDKSWDCNDDNLQPI